MDNNLQFGISTTVLREHPVSYALERIARAGYAAAEVWSWHLEGAEEDPRALARLARDLGLTLTLHAPTDGVNPASRDGRVGTASRLKIADALETGARLKASVVTVHPGRKDVEMQNAEAVWERQLDWLTNLDELAYTLGVRVGLELMERGPLEIFTLPQDAARLMKTSFRQIRLTVDLAHLNTHGEPARLLSEFEPEWILHAHLSDNTPWKVHMPLGEGRLDIAGALDALAQVYRGVVSLEGSVPGRGESVLAGNMAALRKLGYTP